MNIVLQRVYDHESKAPGLKVLVDRLWPRGISKAAAPWDVWLKNIAPSDALRKWYSHDEAKWPEFKNSYLLELGNATDAVGQMRTLLKQHESVTLLYAAKSTEFNNAVVLKEYLEREGC